MKRRFFLSKSVLFWLNLAFWLTLSLIRFLQYNYYSMRSGEDFDMAERSIWLAADFVSMWLLSFAIYFLYLRTRDLRLGKFLALHGLFSLLVGFFNLVLSLSLAIVGMRMYRTPEHTFLGALKINLGNYLAFTVNGMLLYWVILIILFALNSYARYREQQLRAAQLESRLTQAQLQTLKMQLHPHFLFNALHTIAMMIRRDKAESAVQMISGLADLLRQNLARESEQFTSLDQEIRLTEKYLALEQVRFQDTLEVKLDITPESRSVRFPSLLLQPLVENAFKHGIANQLGPALLRISSQIQHGRLQIEIFNTGPLLPPDWDESRASGIGLRNTRTRLAQLYGTDFQMYIGNEAEKGVVVRIEIPMEHEADG